VFVSFASPPAASLEEVASAQLLPPRVLPDILEVRTFLRMYGKLGKVDLRLPKLFTWRMHLRL
jgi:hypothetical protein